MYCCNSNSCHQIFNTISKMKFTSDLKLQQKPLVKCAPGHNELLDSKTEAANWPFLSLVWWHFPILSTVVQETRWCLHLETKTNYMYLIRVCHPDGHHWNYYTGTPSSSRVSATHLKITGGRLNIKMLSYQYEDPHVKDKMVLRPSYL